MEQEAMSALHLQLADDAGLDWAQEVVSRWHYLAAPVDSRCSPLAYIVFFRGERQGCLIFGRPEATRCYAGELTYGSQEDVSGGRAQFDRWELINLARVWLDPRSQGPMGWGHGWLATWAIGQALKRVAADYLLAYLPCFLDEPWRLRVCLSYCDTRIHHGTIYKAAGFRLARTNEDGVETYYRPLRSLQGHERKQIERYGHQSYRSRVYRSQRAVNAIQETMVL